MRERPEETLNLSKRSKETLNLGVLVLRVFRAGQAKSVESSAKEAALPQASLSCVLERRASFLEVRRAYQLLLNPHLVLKDSCLTPYRIAKNAE